MSIELSNLSVEELDQLQANIAKELNDRKNAAKAEALRKIKEIAHNAGVDLSAIVGGKSTETKARAKVAPKYQSKTDPAQTWTGRGRQPAWVAEYIANGGVLEDLLIG